MVIKADLMMEGDQSGWNVFTYAAAPAAWGQDMDVPVNTLNFTLLCSPVSSVGGAFGG